MNSVQHKLITDKVLKNDTITLNIRSYSSQYN